MPNRRKNAHMFDDVQRRYHVVLNDEEQYSIWPEGRQVPAGWEPEGFNGTKEQCLAHIAEVWTDLRPKSLRTMAGHRHG
jgi:MbtH protein